jgi:transcriptional regulator with XRE-family HTH domain
MIKMNIMQQILMMYTHEGKSCREIARCVGMNRETVGKHIRTCRWRASKARIRQYESRRQKLCRHGEGTYRRFAGLLQLSIYYGFQFRFCNVRSGNEKPHVERTVDRSTHQSYIVNMN